MKKFRVFYYTGGVDAMRADRHGSTDNLHNAIRNAAGHVAVSEFDRHEHRLAIIARVDRRGLYTRLRSYKLADGKITIKEYR